MVVGGGSGDVRGFLCVGVLGGGGGLEGFIIVVAFGVYVHVELFLF